MNSAPLIQTETQTAEQLIARVLCRAHGRAEALGAPNDARTILDLAQSFADELAVANPRFDRVRFIKDATEDDRR